MSEKEEILKSLSPIEKKIFPFLNLQSIDKICEKTKLDKTIVLRALEFLSNKNIVKLDFKDKKEIVLGVNGILYAKEGLPERQLLNFLATKPQVQLELAQKDSKLSENEFKAALGVLKKKALITLEAGKIILHAKPAEISKKMLEEKFLEILPLELEQLKEEEKYSFEQLKNRKDVIIVEQKKEINFELTALGKQLIKEDIKKIGELIEQLTPEIIASEKWKSKQFRKYDIKSPLPGIYGGKRHFVNQAIDYARKIWTEMGFKEMSGTLIQSAFWNFDALFTAQDHPVRELHDTFYIKNAGAKVPEKKLVQEVRKAHETGVAESRGWQYKWQEEEAGKVILRTHTTCLSAHTLAALSKLKDKRGKFFAIGKCFRNETVDWSHGFEFNQTEGIVVDRNANFMHLLGYLKEFFKKMGIEKIRFTPAYFPYTEPSVEIQFWHSEKKIWLELGGAGMFRPEVTVPLLGENIPVLAWGPGFDRMIMDYYQIKDLRELYKNDITQLRKMKYWIK